MKRRFFIFGKRQYPDATHHDPHGGPQDPYFQPERPHGRRHVHVLPLLLMMIGMITVMVLAVRYALVPLLVYLGGAV